MRAASSVVSGFFVVSGIVSFLLLCLMMSSVSSVSDSKYSNGLQLVTTSCRS